MQIVCAHVIINDMHLDTTGEKLCFGNVETAW